MACEKRAAKWSGKYYLTRCVVAIKFTRGRTERRKLVIPGTRKFFTKGPRKFPVSGEKSEGNIRIYNICRNRYVGHSKKIMTSDGKYRHAQEREKERDTMERLATGQNNLRRRSKLFYRPPTFQTCFVYESS